MWRWSQGVSGTIRYVDAALWNPSFSASSVVTLTTGVVHATHQAVWVVYAECGERDQ